MLLQIASVLALYGLLEGFNAGIRQAIAATHGDRLYIGSSVSLGDPLPIGSLARIRATPGVVFATARNALPATYQRPDQGVPVIAADAVPFFGIYDEFSAPQPRSTRSSTRAPACSSAKLRLTKKPGKSADASAFN